MTPTTSSASPTRSRLTASRRLVAASVLVALGVAACQSDRSDELPLLVPGDVPEGVAVSRVLELPLEDPSSPPIRQHRYVYGDADTDVDIVITRRADETTVDVDSPVEDAATEDVEVRGHEAVLVRSDGSTRASWEERPSLGVSVASRTLPRDAVLAIAEGLTIRDDRVELGDLPSEVGELDEVGREHSSTHPDDPAARRHAIYYSTPGDHEGPTTFVVVEPGDERELAVVAYDERCDREVRVRGESGWLCVQERETGTDVSVSWIDQAGVLVTVGGWGGVGEDDVLRVAGSLRVATRQEWDDAAKAASAFPAGNGNVEIPGS